MIEIDELILEELEDSVVYENEFFTVYKVICDIQTKSQNWVKRVQLVNWKHKPSDLLEVDIRRYNIPNNRYSKGISFTKREFLVLQETFEGFDFDKEVSDI